MQEIDYGSEGQFPIDVPHSLYDVDNPGMSRRLARDLEEMSRPVDISFTENEQLRRIYLMAPGLVGLAVGAIDFIANGGKLSDLGAAFSVGGALWAIVGYGVGTHAAIDTKVNSIAADLKALDDADEEFKRLHPDKWALLYPISAQREKEEREK